MGSLSRSVTSVSAARRAASSDSSSPAARAMTSFPPEPPVYSCAPPTQAPEDPAQGPVRFRRHSQIPNGSAARLADHPPVPHRRQAPRVPEALPCSTSPVSYRCRAFPCRSPDRGNNRRLQMNWRAGIHPICITFIPEKPSSSRSASTSAVIMPRSSATSGSGPIAASSARKSSRPGALTQAPFHRGLR